ncbi:MAG: (deoxy)nucleoside triphosphate pyrophosphohydrolase [Solobacterium sp.]|jgi:8-oxo-dGTP diphosphatase|nr:(deoxy)nucleoside triphosphate pyrophosphohydrolase [Solobacterium sp.]
MPEERKTVNVVAAIIQKDDRILATQRGYGEFRDWWEFPGGKIENGETPQEALKREIREELRMRICVKDLLGTIEYDYPAFHLSMQCFRAEIEEGTPVLTEHEAVRWLREDELDQVRWLPADETIIDTIRKKMRKIDAGLGKDI